eukprot:scaffold6313_cov113-Isochrysis_galbana.AAC.4
MAPPMAPLGRPTTYHRRRTRLDGCEAPHSDGGDGHGSPLGAGASTRERSGWAGRCDGFGAV